MAAAKNMYHKDKLTKSRAAYMQCFIPCLKHSRALVPNESFFFYFRSSQRVQSLLLLFGKQEFVLMHLIQQGQFEDNVYLMFAYATLDECRKLHPTDPVAQGYTKLTHSLNICQLPQVTSWGSEPRPSTSGIRTCHLISDDLPPPFYNNSQAAALLTPIEQTSSLFQGKVSYLLQYLHIF